MKTQISVSVDLVSTLLDDAFIGLEANKINVRAKSSLCYGNTPKHLLTVEYYKDFIRKYSKKRRFAFSWLNDLSHNYVNFLELGDKDFKEFLMWKKHRPEVSIPNRLSSMLARMVSNNDLLVVS
jgi:hypothetical protein